MGRPGYLQEDEDDRFKDASSTYCAIAMKPSHVIRQLVAKALHIRQLTPDIENEINYELTRLGYISDVDYEALELLMSEMDAGRVRLVPNP